MLTVVLPNFNHACFLDQALAALVNQSRLADEHIIIDDASTDDSIAKIEAWLPELPNARLVRNQTNLGAVHNLNHGMRIASGSEIVFAAADDVIYPAFFETLLGLLERYPQAAFASARTDIIDFDGKRIDTLNAPIPLLRPGYINGSKAAALLMEDEAWFTGNATVFRRKPLLDIGGFPEDLAAFTDGYVSRVLAVKFGSCYTPDALAAWRRIEGGLAWTHAEDSTRAETIASRGELRLSQHSHLFAAGYPKRWQRRHVFGAKRFALANARRNAASPRQWIVAFARELIGTTALFLALRPRDTFVVLRRWLRPKP